MLTTRKAKHVSPLSNFAHNAKAADKKAVYTHALQEAKEEQLRMIESVAKVSQPRLQG